MTDKPLLPESIPNLLTQTTPGPIPIPDYVAKNFNFLERAQLDKNSSLRLQLPQLKLDLEFLTHTALISRCVEVAQFIKCYDPTESQLWTELLTHITAELEARMNP